MGITGADRRVSNFDFCVPVVIETRQRKVPHIAVEIQRLGIGEFSIRHSGCFVCPIRRDEPSQAVGVVASAEVIEAGFGIAFFAGELVVVGIVVDELEFAALSCNDSCLSVDIPFLLHRISQFRTIADRSCSREPPWRNW